VIRVRQKGFVGYRKDSRHADVCHRNYGIPNQVNGMRPFLSAFMGGFLGKIAAAIFIAVCVLLGFGPNEWAAYVVPFAVPVILIRAGFLVLAALTLVGLLSPLIIKRRTKQKKQRELPEKQRSPSVQSKLKILSGESPPLAERRFIRPDIYRAKRTLFLRMENIDPQDTVTDIKVEVLSIEPQTEYPGRAPWVLEEGFSLPAGRHKLIPFARFGEAEESNNYSATAFERSDTDFQILSKDVTKSPILSRDDRHTFLIRATGVGTAPRDYRCDIWVDRPDGRLRIADAIPQSSRNDPYDQTVRWAMENIVEDPHESDAALKLLRQAARDGVVTIYGRPQSGSLAPDQFYKPIERILNDHWRDFDFDVMRCIFHEDTRECRTVPDDRRSVRYDEVYVDLRVNSTQIKAKWPTPIKAKI
jgi:hypothetical protein